MTDPKDDQGNTQDNPNSDDPNLDLTGPDIHYVQNGYAPDIDKADEILNEKKK